MNEGSGRWYRASEFARVAGVTVRALHYYDRLGLLKPSGRTTAGYRMYGERDFARLQQIVTLKFLGFPLKQIKDLLDRDSFDLKAALRLQREIIAEKRRRLGLAISAIESVEHALASKDETDWEAFAKVIEVINMQNDYEWVKKYYTGEQLEQMAARYSPEVQEKAERDWAALIKDVKASLDEDPASEKAQSLAARWEELIERFTGGDPGILENLKNLYADQSNWPSTFKKPYTDEVGAFISKAMAVRKSR
ncbi:MAG TPA: MerR family transcriptional regulator [Blastocatellia bacterium]|nr:MerR family transcriptional regulator [Blastocatellia bacterium]